jgi:hypothetical protein
LKKEVEPVGEAKASIDAKINSIPIEKIKKSHAKQGCFK